MKLPQSPPNWLDAFHRLMDYKKVAQILTSRRPLPAPEGKYRHWDTLRHIEPPESLTSEEWWALIKLSRLPLYRTLPLLDTEGEPFRYALVDPALERLHRIDRDASGHVTFPEQVTNPDTRERYIINSLIEEGITSSQLEGAATTRAVAREMIRTGRRPLDISEQMILNNYHAMQQVRARKQEPLSRDFILDLHRTITTDTLDAGTPIFRQPGDGVAVFWNQNGQDILLHRPPPAGQIEERLEKLCTFANEVETGVFLHPVLKAIILHFWLAYDHPFSDGNGRTARALFYWSMLREGFWLAEYLSISRVLKQAPARYAKSFLYTETDENDLTYFILAQLRVIEQAIKELKHYLQRKMREVQETKALLRPSDTLNHRQVALLSHALRHPGQRYTVESHQTSNAVAYDTARKDLLMLVEAGLLVKEKVSKKFVFRASSDLAERLKTLS